jgi:tRNA (guanine37-N1)-methyltransferase
MRFDILTLFPEFFASPLEQSIIGKAISRGLMEVHTHNIRDFTTDKHHTTDDSPYGGGAGMVIGDTYNAAGYTIRTKNGKGALGA